MQKSLKLDKENGMLSGVLAGFANYFEMDVTILRILFVLFVLVTGFFPGVVGYFIALLIMQRA